MPPVPASEKEAIGGRALLWSLLMGSLLASWAAFVWHGQLARARERAAVAYHKDLGYRVWTANGGDSLSAEAAAPQGPRRRVHQSPPDPEGIATHLASFAHRNREAAPDPWDAAALARLGVRGTTLS